MQKKIWRNLIILFIAFLAVYRLHAQSYTTPSSDGIPISYEVHGSGMPALVFVHGWSCDRSYWREQIDSFAKHFKVVAIDLAGHGKSGSGRKNYTIESFAADVSSVVNKLGLRNFILIGHSMGGDVVVAAAASGLLPRERIKGVVMVDTYKKLGPGRTPEQVKAFVSGFRDHFKDSVKSFVQTMFPPRANPELVQWVANDMSSAPPDIALSALESAFGYSREITKALSAAKVQVTAINSDNSPTDMASMQQYGVDVIIIPHVGHFIMMENPKQFNEMLAEVIDKMAMK